MKKLLSLLLCAAMLLTVFSVSCTAVGGGIISGSYVVSGNWLYNVTEKTSPADFLAAAKVFSSVSSNKFVATGDRAYYEDGTYLTVIVHGDADGDGQVGTSDYLMTKRAVLGTFTPTEAGERAMRAGDSVNAVDYIMLKRHVLGTYDLYSNLHLKAAADYNKTKIAYIPLDNRPVNYDRAVYLASAAGFELLMPDEDLFRTALDNMTPNSNGTTYGDREKLLAWLKSIENECDYYVISLDQMLSGGLVASRWLSNTDLTLEIEISDYLIALAKTKHVVYFDTVMRLASTVNYMGYDIGKYQTLRSYGAIARKTLSGSELTVDNIIAGYADDASGSRISTTLTQTELDSYFASRARKLKLIDYILSSACEDIEFLYIGVDDSSPTTTIQTNEINYIESIAGDNSCLFAGADELGLMGIARISSALYGEAQTNVTYFGEGQNKAADSFDIGTLDQSVRKHLSSVGATYKSSAENALQILILTKTSSIQTNSAKLISQLKSNIENIIPTVVIDCSTETGALQARMTAENIELSMLLGYSNWNTVANALGIAISQGVSRYLYLRSSLSVSAESNEAFLKSMTFAYIKDISYKCAGISLNSIASDTSAYGGKTLLALINSSEMLVSLGKTASHGTVSVSRFRYPWNRTFEMTFDIKVAA